MSAADGLQQLVVDLITAMRGQTEAINALAASNMALVDAMIEDVDGEDGEELSRTYLDGSLR